MKVIVIIGNFEVKGARRDAVFAKHTILKTIKCHHRALDKK